MSFQANLCSELRAGPQSPTEEFFKQLIGSLDGERRLVLPEEVMKVL